MAKIIKERRNIKIENSIIKTSDIRDITVLFDESIKRLINNNKNLILKDDDYRIKSLEEKGKSEKEIESLKEEIIYDSASFEYFLNAENNSNYTSDTSEIILKDNYIDTKKIHQIILKFNLYKISTSIYVNISHSIDSDRFGSYIEIVGTDSIWVNGVTKQFENLIENFQRQNNIFDKYGNIIYPIISTTIGYSALLILAKIIYYVNFTITNDSKMNIPVYIVCPVILIFSFLIGLSPTAILISKIEKLWPFVEIQTGKEYMQIEKKIGIL